MGGFTKKGCSPVGLTEEEAKAQFGDSIKCDKAKFRPMFYR